MAVASYSNFIISFTFRNDGSDDDDFQEPLLGFAAVNN